MSVIRLRKILFKKEELSLINNMISNMKSHVSIIDAKNVLISTDLRENISGERYPILAEKEVIGYVIGEKEVESLVLLITYFVNSEIEKKKFETEILEKYRELALLYNFSERMATSLNIEEIAGLAIAEAKKYIPATVASVMIQNEYTGKLEIASEFSKYNNRFVFNAEDAIINNILMEGKAEIIDDLPRDSRHTKSMAKIKSMICVPIMVKNANLGIIVFGHEKHNMYSNDHLKLFWAIAFQTAVSIENAKLYSVLEETFFQTIKALAESLEMRDPYTGGHTQRVMNYSMVIGSSMGLSKAYMSRLKLAALMHDIGKIGIGDSILLKGGKLTSEEFKIMKKHTEYGSEVLKNIKHFNDILPGVRNHHERYDGKGYPDGLKGEKIPLMGRIIAVADSFDAMVSDRPYRKALDLEFAIDELKQNAGTQFDPKIVKAFVKVYNEKGLQGLLDFTEEDYFI